MINRLLKDDKGFYMRTSGMSIPVEIHSDKELKKAKETATWVDRRFYEE